MALIKEIPVGDEQLAGIAYVDDSKSVCYVDLPFIDRYFSGWHNVNMFATKQEAVSWLRELLGEQAVDDDGRVCLLTLGGAENDNQR